MDGALSIGRVNKGHDTAVHLTKGDDLRSALDRRLLQTLNDDLLRCVDCKGGVGHDQILSLIHILHPGGVV